MRYEGDIYRPPSEANSLLIQVTIGCSYNKCTYCSMYSDKQFRIRDFEEIKEDILNFPYKDRVDKVFLCDGDALVIPTDKLIDILVLIKENFKNVTRVSSYATFQDVQRKSVEELKQLKELGLDLVYLGAESGSDKVLEKVNKGVTSSEMIQACDKLHAANVDISVMILSGLGGQELFNEHAIESARLINAINPKFFGLLAVVVQENTPLYEEMLQNKFHEINSKQALEELGIIISNVNVENCFFSSNHVSNYVFLKGNLSQDKERLLKEIKQYQDNADKVNRDHIL